MNPRKNVLSQKHGAKRVTAQQPGKSYKPGVAQPKMIMASQTKKPPAAPPVYRPQPAPKVLQAKAETSGNLAGTIRTPTSRKTPQAPLAYRPQPAPKVLQTKSATAKTATPQRAGLKPKSAGATPRAASPPAQPKMARTLPRASAPWASSSAKPTAAQPPLPAKRPPADNVPPRVIQPMSLVSINTDWKKTRAYFLNNYELSTQQVDFGAGPEATFVCNRCNRRLPRVLATVDHVIPKSRLWRMVERDQTAPGDLNWLKVKDKRTGRTRPVPKLDFLREEFLKARVHLDLENLQLMCTACNSGKSTQ